MDRKEKKSGDPFGGAPMKRLEPTQMPTPPDVTELLGESEGQEVKKEEQEDLCPCGFPNELCLRFNGNPLLIALYMGKFGDEP